MASLPCALNCGKPVNPYDNGVWKEVTGFVGGPKKDSMRLRTDTGRFAHDACVHKASMGQAPDQPAMDEPEVLDEFGNPVEPDPKHPEWPEDFFEKPEEVAPRDEPKFHMSDGQPDDKHF